MRAAGKKGRFGKREGWVGEGGLVGREEAGGG